MLITNGFTNEELIYILVFYSIGALLGYLSFRCSYEDKLSKKIVNCLTTTGLGVYLAYILANYLEENHIFSKNMNMLVGGLLSFGLPDIVIRYYPMVTRNLVGVVVSKIEGYKKNDRGSTDSK